MVSTLFRFTGSAFACFAIAVSFATAQPADIVPLEPVQIDDGSDKPLSAEDPEQPIEAESAEAETEEQARAEEAAAQAALESELASATRFEAELAKLLLPSGQLDTSQGDDAAIKLSSLATRCGILANSAMHDEVRLLLLGYQARSLAALASIEPAAQGQAAGRMEQLNDTAQQLAAIDLPGAAATADYWLLIADVAQRSSRQRPAQRLARTERALVAYTDRYQDDPHATDFVLDTRLSLANLMVQRGAQRDALKQLEAIGTLPADSPRENELARLRENVARLGKPIAFESLSTELNPWRSSDHKGKPVLIHVYADSVEPSLRMIDVIGRSIVEGAISGIAVVSLRVGEPIAGTQSPPWPTLPVQLEPDGVLDQLGVAALPTLAWLDHDGKLASIGSTPAVLKQLESITPKENEPDAEPADAPLPERSELEAKAEAEDQDEPEPEPEADRDDPTDDDADTPDN